jgi:N-acetylornithine carbamoyltransferase
MKHFYNLADLTIDEVEGLLDDAARLKREPITTDLAGMQFGLIFLAPSLRTRTSFEVGIRQMGGGVSTLEPAMFYGLEIADGMRMDGDTAEHIREAVPVLSRFFSGIGLRVMAGGQQRDEDLEDRRFLDFRKYATVPMFNMESSLYHPCQALADMLTLREILGANAGKRLTLTWAPHPKPLPTAVPNSLVLAAAQTGMEVTVAHPEGYGLPEAVMARAEDLAASVGGSLRTTNDRATAAHGAEVVYAKSWGALSRYETPSAEQAARESHHDWMVDDDFMSRTANAYFMHCLPVRRNVVVSDSVIDGERSMVVDQAENRLHAQKAILRWLLA